MDVILTNRATANHRSIELMNLNQQWESRGFQSLAYRAKTRDTRRRTASGMMRDRLTSRSQVRSPISTVQGNWKSRMP
jgi:hypothetical protein